MGQVSITINDKELEAEAGSMIIEVADQAGIEIPRFCYHKKLSVAANCRMCLVEVHNLPKPVPACATPIADGMKVLTASEKARQAQKSVMEFLLINHPLDCPICDQGGECELQDLALGYGNDTSRFSEGKRVVVDKDIGPLIETEMTRCIHCTRCVRFGTEVVGMRELGATGRGEHMEIGTYIEKSLVSELAGNVIDLCPVGALTAKPSRYQARAWEMQSTEAIAPHDCLGTNVTLHHRRSQLIRVVPRENEAINEVWISDRDRYSYEAITRGKRLTSPMVKKGDKWHSVDWQTALETAVTGFKTIIDKHGANGIGALSSPSSTTEESYLIQKICSGLGSKNIDHRLRQIDFSTQHDDPMMPQLEFSLSSLEEMDASLLIGTDLRAQQPLLNVRLRKATRFGKVMAISMQDNQANYRVEPFIKSVSSELCEHLHGIVAALISMQKDPISATVKELFVTVSPSDVQTKVARNLLAAENACVMVGVSALEHTNSGHIRWLARTICRLSGAQYGELTPGANSAGAYLAGVLPHRDPVGQESDICGWNTQQMLQKGLPGYLIFNCEPELDSSYRDAARLAFIKAEHIVVCTPFADGECLEYADVLLPIAAPYETSGSYINVEGKWQEFQAAVASPGDSRPGWKVLRVLGNFLKLDDFDFSSSDEVRNKLKQQFEHTTDAHIGHLHNPEQLEKGGEIPKPLDIYDIDSMVRRSHPLQLTPQAQKNWRREIIADLCKPPKESNNVEIEVTNV